MTDQLHLQQDRMKLHAAGVAHNHTYHCAGIGGNEHYLCSCGWHGRVYDEDEKAFKNVIEHFEEVGIVVQH